MDRKPEPQMSRRKALKHVVDLAARNKELQEALDTLKHENLDRAYTAILEDMKKAAADLGVPFPESAKEGDGGQRVVYFVRDLFGALTRANQTVTAAQGTLAEIRRILDVKPDAPILDVVEQLKRERDALAKEREG